MYRGYIRGIQGFKGICWGSIGVMDLYSPKSYGSYLMVINANGMSISHIEGQSKQTMQFNTV